MEVHMLNGKRICVVMPAYNAERTLEKTFTEIPKDIVDTIILVDDGSRDDTAHISKKLGIRTIIHDTNKGYGGNQKTCYREALASGADIVVMVHPDYQYTPLLITAISSMIAYGVYDVVLASRILGGTSLRNGMPLYKYISNRVLTLIQNLLMRQKVSEYHTGYRAYAREVLEHIPLENNSDDFIFDNEILAQIFKSGFAVGEISCPTKYFPEASSINLRRSIIYGLGVIGTSLRYFLSNFGFRFKIFNNVVPYVRRSMSAPPLKAKKKAHIVK